MTARSSHIMSYQILTYLDKLFLCLYSYLQVPLSHIQYIYVQQVYKFLRLFHSNVAIHKKVGCFPESLVTDDFWPNTTRYVGVLPREKPQVYRSGAFFIVLDFVTSASYYPKPRAF